MTLLSPTLPEMVVGSSLKTLFNSDGLVSRAGFSEDPGAVAKAPNPSQGFDFKELKVAVLLSVFISPR